MQLSQGVGIGAFALLLGGVLSVRATTYYVDFEGGDNARDGQSPAMAWKHSPGDPNATDRPASAALVPGDTVIFKGGVVYHGTIRLTASGAPNQPITLDGNSSGAFGQGRAILDGGRVIRQWRRCASAEEARGNPCWKDIFIAELDLDISSNFHHGQVVVHRQVPRDRQAPWQRIILFDGDRRLLPIAQLPKPSDPFYPDLPGDFFRSPKALEVRPEEGVTVLTDEANLQGRTPDFFDGAFVGVHGGNNHVYFATVSKYDPVTGQVQFAEFKDSTYRSTAHAYYNSVRFIELPGEWAIEPVGPGRTRIYLLADRLEGGQPANVGFPEFETGLQLASGASHYRVRSFLIQRFSGGNGGVAVERHQPRSKDIAISDCEIRFVSGHAGIGPHHCDEITIENCYVHHCPGWTTAVFLNRVNDYLVRNCRLDKNSGSGIRHYECQRGRIEGNVILRHYGMHSSTINVYEGCADVVIERNYMHNTVTINRNAENILFRHNIIDSQGRAAVNLAMWTSGRTRGRDIRNIQFINNTFVNPDRAANWSTSIFNQTGRGASPPTGLVVKHNVLDRLTPPLPGEIEGNIFMRETDPRVQGSDSVVESDPRALFQNPESGDYRRRPGGPKMEAGAEIPPPPADWLSAE
jgi:hypothetical protein